MHWSAFNLLAGWLGVIAGVVSGAVIGMFFHRDAWLGGYGSYQRRMVRLGHIAFFGMGFVNILFALTAGVLAVPEINLKVASAGFLVGLVGMPLCCFLTAWRKPLRHLFPIPVTGVLVGVTSLLLGWTGS
ncbi:MAG: hypothetical protein PVF91_05295 [Chromatiales bacterium]|jgi:hypothetical protein